MTNEPHGTAAASGEHVAAPIGSRAAAEALKHGPRGALFVAGIAVVLLVAGQFDLDVLLIDAGKIGGGACFSRRLSRSKLHWELAAHGCAYEPPSACQAWIADLLFSLHRAGLLWQRDRF